MRKLVLLIALFLTACAKPLPPERANYAGIWHGNGVEMKIGDDGMVTYDRRQGSSYVNINGPIKTFEGDDFIVGIGPLTTRFDVTSPPSEVDGRWEMTVDGRQLVREEKSLSGSSVN